MQCKYYDKNYPTLVLHGLCTLKKDINEFIRSHDSHLRELDKEALRSNPDACPFTESKFEYCKHYECIDEE